jgi:hypothetical protein
LNKSHTWHKYSLGQKETIHSKRHSVSMKISSYCVVI